MDRLTTLLSWCRTVIGAGAAVLAIYLGKIENNLNRGLYMAFILISLVIFIKVTESLLKHVIGLSRRLRHFLFGNSFVEGLWVDVVVDKTHQAVLFGGIILFRYKDGFLHESGWSFNVDGKFMGTFETITTIYDDLCLRYTYNLDSTGSEPLEIKGYGETRFKPEPDGPPITYTGFFFDPVHHASLHVYGEKLSDPKVIDGLHTLDGKREKVMEFIRQYDEVMPFRTKAVERFPTRSQETLRGPEVEPPKRIEPGPSEVERAS